jgi:stage II sporulation protein D
MKQLLNYIGDNEVSKYYRRLKPIFIILFIFLIISMEVMANIPIIRVGIFIDYKNISLRGDKGLKIFDLSTGEILLLRRDSKMFKIAAEPQGIKINEQSFKIKKGIKIIPIADGFLEVQDKKYRGDIEINVNKSLLKVINIVEVEKYLYGVLKKEISPEWPAEVLKAQAIAARTFALSNMNKFISQGFNVCATTSSQEYGGVFCEHPATNKAINDTRGIVATYEGQPINAVYHSDSGGCTENCEDVWGGYVPYLRSVTSEYEAIVSPPNHQWSYTLTGEEFLTKLSRNDHKLNSIEEVFISEKTESGRVKSVDIIGDNGKKISLKTNDFRLLIGPGLIRSTLFIMESDGGNGKEEIEEDDCNIEDEEPAEGEEPQRRVSDILKEDRDFSITELIALLNRPKGLIEPKVVVTKPKVVEEREDANNLILTFKGKGSGHGVGLSQWGAYGMATRGFKYEEILKYYYQGIKLSKIY